LWTSGVRPGRKHDMSAARADPDLLARITEWVGDGALALGPIWGTKANPTSSAFRSRSPPTRR
jgi:hypothetical protein